MRSSSEVLIYIDVAKAMAAGHKFFRSANGVVLSEGDDNGFIPPEYFARIELIQGEDGEKKGVHSQSKT